MFVSRFVLVVTLVLLQCIAPLVHAHTHESLSAQGIHIPELEVYESTPERQPMCHAKSCHDEGMVVGVNTGVHRDMALPVQIIKKWLVDETTALLPSTVIVPTFQLVFISDLVFSCPVLNHHFDDFVHAPRAPPVLV